ncbi:transcriptional regulator [Oleiharenicola lentus]|uniref:Transcriptional regulator n=1 Tax=Oleiharenicola lentus TaxID=2508720 RepID=A0A4Q1C5H7_9BACT|nr:helix-turn-helix domain-containing protein [Oleiharenicola lentus]RXK53661.1 transcriptional regulator [Oleiharenicola lentus]
MTSVAELIQKHRKKAGLSQAGLASLAGVGKTVIWDIENGKESVQWDTLLKIFRVLNITAEWRSPLLEREAMASASSSPTASASSSPDSSAVAEARTPV